MDNHYLTTKEAAQYLKVSVRTIQHWAKTDQLRASRIGRQNLRFRKEDLDKMVRPVQPSA